MPPNTLSTPEAVGLTGGVLVLVGVIWRAVRGSAKASTRGLVIEDEPTFADAVFAVFEKNPAKYADVAFAMLERNPHRLKAFMSGPSMFERDILERNDGVRVAREAAAQLRSMAELITNMPAAVDRLARAVESVELTLERLTTESARQGRDLSLHGREVAELRGEVTAWTGQERRGSHDRRHARGLRASDDPTEDT